MRSKKSVKKSDKSKTENIVIIGSGPAGLASAIEAAKNNQKKRKIYVIYNRGGFARSQVFRLDSTALPYLESLIGIKAINPLLSTEKLIKVPLGYYVIQINTLENALFEQASQYKKIRWIKVSGNDDFRINEETSEIEFKNKIKIRFKYIIACDGSKHSIANNIAKNNLIYDTTQSSQIHDTHLTALYILPGGRDATQFYLSLLEKNQNQEIASDKMKKMGWELNSAPEARIFVVNNLLYIGTECPKSNFNYNDWARAVLESYLPAFQIRDLTVLLDSNYSPDFKKFTVALDEANRTVIPLAKNNSSTDTYFFQIGDALRKPHYQTGSGAMMSLLEARVLGLFFASEESHHDLALYHSRIASIRDENRSRVDTYLEDRKLRELKALVSKHMHASELTLREIISFCKENTDTALSYLNGITNPSRKTRILAITIAKELIDSCSSIQEARYLLSIFEKISYMHDRTTHTIIQRKWNGAPTSKGFQEITNKYKEKIANLSGKNFYNTSLWNKLFTQKQIAKWGLFKTASSHKSNKNSSNINTAHFRPSK